MTNKRNIFHLILLTFLLILPLFYQIKPQSTLLSDTHPKLKLLNGVTLSINGNPALASAASSGDGSAETPYIIKDKIINASGAGTHGIYIRNTNAYFILRNCTVTDTAQQYQAVHFYNVTHARLENINANHNHGVAIYLNCSNLNTLIGTIANNNYLTSIALWKCLYNNLTATTVNRNSYGLNLDSSNYTTISGISATDNIQAGIYFVRSFGTTLTDAASNGNNYGISLYSCNYSQIVGNTANNNRFAGIRLGLSHLNLIAENYASNNPVGIELASSNYNLVTGNTLFNNSECITEENCTGNTLGNNNCGNFGNPLLVFLIILIPIVGVSLGLFILYRRRELS